jgi:four helix bundle protein
MTRNNILADKSINFAIRMAKCYKYLMDEKQEFIMSKQMFRSGTSIGANIHEAIQAQSKADFVSKLGISLKEASETKYWLELLYESEYIAKSEFDSLINDINTIVGTLVNIVNKVQNK